MNALQIINIIIVSLGLPSIIIALIYIGKKLQILDTLESTSEKLKHNVKVIADNLVTKATLDPRDLQSYSPVELTALGKEKIKRLGFDKIVSDYKNDFFDFIKTEEADTKYDVEIASRKAIVYLFDKDYFDQIKSYLYENPKIDERTLRTTLSVYLRDQYLEEHPDIK